ncbi:MAG: anthranilate synthase component I [Chloroflexota bacterium]|nr:anthranilate synthase component I [Chloroflexota bacterium]
MLQTATARQAAVPPRRGELTPSLDQVRDLVRRGVGAATTVPIYRETLADLETPVSAFLKVRDAGPAFLLESIEGGERLARYSFIGARPLGVLRLDGSAATFTGADGDHTKSYSDPLTCLGEMLAPYQALDVPGLALPRFVGGAVGYLSYEAVRSFEPRVPSAPGPGLGLPDAMFMLVDSLLVFDHIARTTKAVAHVSLDRLDHLEANYAAAADRVDALVHLLRAPASPPPRGASLAGSTVESRLRPNMTRDYYGTMIERAKRYIRAGDIFQVVLSQRVDVTSPADPFSIYRAFRTVNPSPYMFYLDFVDHQIVGASPEMLVRLEGSTLSYHPIAGTRPRGATPELDITLAAELLADEKERAEHIMLVDLGRNDIGRVSKPGTVRVPNLMDIERYSHVMHIVSDVEGEIADGLTGLDALRACFPAGTVSGAPKVRAMEIIAELEPDRRGPYAGAVGYVDFTGGIDTAIALRTMVVKDGVVSMQAGGGVVADSTADGEYAETLHKMHGPMRAIELAEEIEAMES